MPGILGILADKSDMALFNDMQKKMDHLSYSIDTHVKGGIHLATISQDKTNPSCNSIVIYKNEYILAFYGEIFSNDTEILSGNCNYGEYFVSLFIKYGIEVLKSINGHYSACLINNKTGTAYLIADRFGTVPVYYAWNKARLLFASELKAVVQGLDTKEINLQSIAELFSFGHLFGIKTMFNEVKLVSSGTYMEITDKGIREIKYWDFPYLEEIYFQRRISKSENNRLQEELHFIMMKAIQRMSKDPNDILFSLSGGLDSRYVAALYYELGLKNMTAFTMGPNESEDQIYAKEVSGVLGIDHYPFPINPAKIWENARQFAYISDSMSFIHGPLQNFEPLQFFSNRKKFVVYAQMCDALFGSTLWRKRIRILKNSPRHTAETDNIMLNLFSVYNQEWVKMLFRKDFYHQLKGKYTLEPSTYLNREYHPLHCYYLLLMNEHGRRGTLGGNLVTNLFYKTRMPSYDNDVFAFGWNLPIPYRMHQYLYRMTFARYFPELATIKREGYNLNIGASMFSYECKVFKNKVVTLLKKGKLGYLAALYKPWNRPEYVDYKNWFRNELKQDILNFFLKDDLKSSEIIDKNEVIKMLNMHLSGKYDFSGLLWQLVNLEYFYRNFID